MAMLWAAVVGADVSAAKQKTEVAKLEPEGIFYARPIFRNTTTDITPFTNTTVHVRERAMKIVVSIAMVLAFLLPAEAGYSCTSRKSGSYTKTSCSHGRSTHCTAYMSGSTRRTSCS